MHFSLVQTDSRCRAAEGLMSIYTSVNIISAFLIVLWKFSFLEEGHVLFSHI